MTMNEAMVTIFGQINAAQTMLETIKPSLAETTRDDLCDWENDIAAARRRALPQGYFCNVAWDVLIELDYARRHGIECVFPKSDFGNGVSASTQRRFIVALGADGFVAWEPAPDQAGGMLVQLTDLGRASLSRVFRDAADLHALDDYRARDQRFAVAI